MINSCNKIKNSKIIKVSENKMEFRIKNNSSFMINLVRVDGCYIKSGKKCDYLFEILDNNNLLKVFYIELKGQHIKEAIEQLEETLKYCLSFHKNIDRSCYIIASKVPKATTSTQKLKKEFRRKNGVMLYIDTKQKEVIV
jgi:transposase-like protein